LIGTEKELIFIKMGVHWTRFNSQITDNQLVRTKKVLHCWFR
jgi:hypothetical protein